jgi:hypothetical protein
MGGLMRDRILTAAVSVMRERGVAATTTKEIARVAGVAEGSIYNHFANKTELVAASMAQVASGIRDALARLAGQVGHHTVEENLAELAEAEIAFFTELLPITGPVLGDRTLREWLHAGGPGTTTAPARSGETDGAPEPTGGGGDSRPPDAAEPAEAVPPPGPSGIPWPGAGSEPPGGRDVTDPHDAAGAPRPGAPGPGMGGPLTDPADGRREATPVAPPGPVTGHAAVIAYLEAEQVNGRLATWARPPYLAALLIGACQQYAFLRLLTPAETISAVAGLPADPAEYARQVAHVVMAGHHARRARPR